MTQSLNSDLHVESLTYTLRPDEGFSYANPPPLDFETEEASFHLADGILICEMKMHFSDAEEARKAVEPSLRAWETHVDLLHNRGQLRFKFERPHVVNRSVAPRGGAISVVVGSAMVMATGTVSVHVTSNSYPGPPPDYFRLNPDAESILQRYRGYLDSREPLPSMCYFCLTALHSMAGGVVAAAARYQIHKDVLRKMGELSSTRGDHLNARKASAVRALSVQEVAWLEAAVKMLILRLGDTRDNAHLPWITMNDLPKL